MLLADRRFLHKRIAEALEARVGSVDVSDDDLARELAKETGKADGWSAAAQELADHRQRSTLVDGSHARRRAGLWWAAAAWRAERDSAFESSIELATRAAQLLEGGAERDQAVVEILRGRALVRVGRRQEAETLFADALGRIRGVASSSGDRDDRAFAANCLHGLGLAAMEGGRLDAAESHASAAFAIARSLGNRRIEAMCLHLLGNVKTDRGSFEESARIYREALAAAREGEGRRLEAVILQ